jgi:hypothetical protein
MANLINNKHKKPGHNERATVVVEATAFGWGKLEHDAKGAATL